MTDPEWVIQRIRKAHVREYFDCGEASLNGYIQKYARQNDALGLGRTFVATKPGDVRALGYYTLRTGSVEFEDLPEAERHHFPKYPIPVIHLGRLAVDRSAQGQRLGEALLVHALRKAYSAAEEVGAFAVEVLALHDRARAFYLKYGFRELKDDKLHLYLPMGTIRQLFGDA